MKHFHNGEPMEYCPKCKSLYGIGQWPMCRGKGFGSDHGKVHPMPAQKGAPTVVFSDGKGNIDYPLADGRPPKGFEQRIELRNQSERDAFEKSESFKAKIDSERTGVGLDVMKSLVPTPDVGEMRAWKETLTTPVARAFMDKVIERKQKGTLGGPKKKSGDGSVRIAVNHEYVGKKKVKI